jgi:protein involved in polysaccharide export with SLBB domain
MRSGVMEANPLMRAGAHITVQPFDENGPMVEIGGGVVFPGRYEWLPTDDIMDLVEVAGGFRTDVSVDTVILTHFQKNGTPESEAFSVEELLEDPERGKALLPGDLVSVMMYVNSPQWATVVVQGEVKYPGTYPVMLGKTRLSEVIEQAGGLTDNAYLKGARIWRVQQSGDYLKHERTRLDSLSAQLFSDIETAYLRYHSRSLDRDYVVVDFEKVLSGSGGNADNNDILLEENLVINVPQEKRTVMVTGFVNNPGIYPYVEGESYKYYVKQAGDYAKRAHKSRVRIVPFESPVWLFASSKKELGPGDMIFVPSKKEGMDWEIFSQSFMLIIQTGTLVTLIIRTLEN